MDETIKTCSLITWTKTVLVYLWENCKNSPNCLLLKITVQVFLTIDKIIKVIKKETVSLIKHF